MNSQPAPPSNNFSPPSSLPAWWQSVSASVPQLPGVYWFLDGSDTVLYVGKAKNLANRLHQYAYGHDTRPQIHSLLEQVQCVRFESLRSELLALLIEANLIKKYQPHFNILLKDDKSSLYICISKGTFARVTTARRPEILRSSAYAYTFGPFQSGYKVKQVLSIARKIFCWCDHPQSGKACFYYHIGRCAGACIGTVSSSVYDANIKKLVAFLRGKTRELEKELRDEIQKESTAQHYEIAAPLRDQLRYVQEITSPKHRLAPDPTLPILTSHAQNEALLSLREILRRYLPLPAQTPLSRIEGYDISNISGTDATCSLVVALDGKMVHSEYKHFGIKTIDTPNDFLMLQEALTRRQRHPEWGIPDVVLIDGGKGQLRRVLSIWHFPSIVISIAKDPDRLFIPILGQTLGSPKARHVLPLQISYREIVLSPDLPATRLLQTIRDESHRFARRLHHNKRDKHLLQ